MDGDRVETGNGPVSAADRFVHGLGIRLRSLEVGRAVVELEVTAGHCNDVGVVHGGVLFTLADAALAAASNARVGELAVAITGTIHFLQPARPGDRLVAEATEDRRGGRLGTYAIRVREGEEVIATAVASTLLVGRRAGDHSAT